MLFTHKYETPKEQKDHPELVTRFDKKLFHKEREASLRRTQEAISENQARKNAEAAGKVAVIGAKQAGEAGSQIDPSHELTAHASEVDPNQAA